MSGLIVRDPRSTDPMDPLAPPEKRAEWEAKVGTDSLETLHAKRREILEELKPLKVLHGSNGKWEAKRVQMGRALQIKARMDIEKRGEKPTEKYVEAEALGSEEYLKFVDRAIADGIRYLELENAFDEVNDRISSREIEFRAHTAEARL